MNSTNNAVYYDSGASDGKRLPEDLVALYDDGTATEGELIYMPKSA